MRMCILEKIIDLKDITVKYGENVVLDKLNLYINKKEFITLLGPSGCGKTTTLRCIAGFIEPDGGDIIFEGKRINDVPPHKRKVNTIFQRYALFSHLNVYENIAFGLKLQKKPKSEIRKTVAEMLELVNLKGFEKRSIDSLSGGQQQRVAIARALANSPHVLLLDEPLSALDLKLRKDMQTELKAIQKRLGITFIYVTHDQEEALSMSDTVVVMDKGKIQQIGTPEDIYNEPVNAFVADFIGESNIVDAIMIKDYLVSFGGVTFECLDSGFGENAFVEAVVRPEDIKIVKKGSKASLPGKITSVTFKGVHFEILVDVGGFIWMIQTIEHHKVGEEIGMYIEPDAIHIMNRSEYSGEFGDYSYFSDEMDHTVMHHTIGRKKMKKNKLSSLADKPYLVWSILFIIAPLLMVAYYALTDKSGAFSLASVEQIPTYITTILLSVLYGVAATAICLVLGFPFAYIFSKAPQKYKNIVVLLVMLPMWMNFLIRTYSWMTILGDSGVINTILNVLGLKQLKLINNGAAVILGMVYNFLPYMILPIFSVLTKLDNSLVEAAQDLGSNKFEVIKNVIIPLSNPGILSGITMVFVPCVSTFYITQKLGGGQVVLIGDVIETQFQSANNYNLGAALSFVLMILIFICLGVMNYFGADENGDGGVII